MEIICVCESIYGEREKESQVIREGQERGRREAEELQKRYRREAEKRERERKESEYVKLNKVKEIMRHRQVDETKEKQRASAERQYRGRYIVVYR